MLVLAGCSPPASAPADRSADPTPAESTGGPTPSAVTSGTPASCAVPTPTGITSVQVGAERVLEAVLLTSDGAAVRPGSRQRAEWTRPELTGPDGTIVSSDVLTRGTANLLSAQRSLRLLATRPTAPEVGVTAQQPPFDGPGRYVLYISARSVSAEIEMTCQRSVQRWRLAGDADAGLGQFACAGTPSPAPEEAALAAELRRRLC